MKWLPLVVLLGAGCSAAPVDFGSLSLSGTGIARGIHVFGGSGFNVYATSDYGFLAGGSWQPGSTVVPNLYLSDFRSGSATIGSVSYPYVIWSDLNSHGKSLLEVKASPVLLTGPGTFYGTFQFTGDLCGYTSAPVTGECAIVLPALTGDGIYSLSVTQVDNGSGPIRLDVVAGNYSFGTPEPATFWLLGSGLAVLAASSRRRSPSPRS